MPIYEYICVKCGKKSSYLILSSDDYTNLSCKCGSSEIEKVVSRFGISQTEDSRIERLTESAMRDVDYTNPESMRNWMRKMAREFSDETDINPDELVESISDEAMQSKKVPAVDKYEDSSFAPPSDSED